MQTISINLNPPFLEFIIQNKLIKHMSKAINRERLLSYIRQTGISKHFEQHFQSQKIPKQLKLVRMSAHTIGQLCDKINDKSYSWADTSRAQTEENGERWRMGEFKLFIWVSVFYSYNCSITIHQLTQNNLAFLKSFFPQKSTLRLQYELFCLLPSEGKKKGWEIQQIQLFKKLVLRQQQMTKKIEWKTVSCNLYTESQGKYFKTFSQCRQRWINHLDSTINKNVWTKQEDYKLLILAQQENKSWSRISKKFNQKRTAHMIKNRYNALIKASKRYNNRMNDTQAENKLIRVLAAKIEKQKSGGKLYIDRMEAELSLESESKEKDPICESYETKCWMDSSRMEADNDENLYDVIEIPLSPLKSQTNPLTEGQFLDLKMVDFNLSGIPEYFTQTDDLLQKLGCAHIEQLEQAFQCYNQNPMPFF